MADDKRSKTDDQIKELEKELATTKYNKATQHHIGLVKAKLAKLKEKAVKKSGGGGVGFNVKRSGDATVVLLGFPSVGKSTILNAITNAKSVVAQYEFTTLDVIPGTMFYQHAKIQVLDVPGIVYGAASGRGRGKEVLSMIRSANLIVIVLDALHPEHKDALEKEVYEAGIRLDQKLPDVRIYKTQKGGVVVSSTLRLKHLTKQMVKDICKEFKINNAEVLIRENITVDQLIDVIEANKVYIPSLTVLNKVDLVLDGELATLRTLLKPHLEISAKNKQNMDAMKEKVFERLQLMRIYLKEIGKKPDMKEPLIISQDATIRVVGQKLHREFISKFKFARIWGPSAKFPGQDIRKLNKKLQDEDVLEFHLI